MWREERSNRQVGGGARAQGRLPVRALMNRQLQEQQQQQAGRESSFDYAVNHEVQREFGFLCLWVFLVLVLLFFFAEYSCGLFSFFSLLFIPSFFFLSSLFFPCVWDFLFLCMVFRNVYNYSSVSFSSLLFFLLPLFIHVFIHFIIEMLVCTSLLCLRILFTLNSMLSTSLPYYLIYLSI